MKELSEQEILEISGGKSLLLSLLYEGVSYCWQNGEWNYANSKHAKKQPPVPSRPGHE
jgi:hypothetical protein